MALYEVPAPAKLNLFLHVTGRRPDGYHTLQTVFRFIDLCDTLDFDLRQDGRIHREGEGLAGLAEEHDLVVRAARALQEASGTDRKSTRLNSSHVKISYAVFCLKKKKIKHNI